MRYLVIFLFLSSIFANSQKAGEAKVITSKIATLLKEKEMAEDINEKLFEQYKDYIAVFAKSTDEHSLIRAYRILLNSNIKIAKKEMNKIGCNNIYSVDNLKYLPSGSCVFFGNLNLKKSDNNNAQNVYKGVEISVLNAKSLDITDGLLKYKNNTEGKYVFEYLGKITDKKFEGIFISSMISSEIHNLLKDKIKNLTNDAKDEEEISQSSNDAIEEMASKLKNTDSKYGDYYVLLGRLKIFLKNLRKENGGKTDLIDVYASDAYFFNLLFAVSYKRSQKDKNILLKYQKAYMDNHQQAKLSYENYYKDLLAFNKDMDKLKSTKNYFSGLVLKMQNDAYEAVLQNNKKIEIFNEDIASLNKKYKIYNLNNKKLAKIELKDKPQKAIYPKDNDSLYKKNIGVAYRNKYIYKEIKKNDELKNFLIENADYGSGLHSGVYFGLHSNFVNNTNNLNSFSNLTYGGDFSMGYFYKHFALGFDVAGYGTDENNFNYATFVDLKFNFSAVSFTGLYAVLGYGLVDIKKDFGQKQFAKFALGFNIPLVRFGSVQANVLGLDFNVGYLANINDFQNKLDANKLLLSLGLLLSF